MPYIVDEKLVEENGTLFDYKEDSKEINKLREKMAEFERFIMRNEYHA